MESNAKHAVIVGGGASGIFAAIHLASIRPDISVHLYEKSNQLLSKVKVSGGGRCNVTHHCFEPRELVKFYPRGQKELIGPFHRFNPADTVAWFADHSVKLKTEADGRMFPVTDSSQTIMNALIDAALDAGVVIQKHCALSALVQVNGKWQFEINGKDKFLTEAIMIATGSSEKVWELLQKTGLKIVPPVPSLFTFHIRDKVLQDLSGVSVANVTCRVFQSKLKSSGPLLFTHWGLSGPAILRLSAWGAREFFDKEYKFKLLISFLTEYHKEDVFEELKAIRTASPRKQVGTYSPYEQIPKRLWLYLLKRTNITIEKNWADLNNKDLNRLSSELTEGEYEVNGKSTFKEEFVTCGGIALEEINFKTYEAIRYPGLFFGGEALDADALTGGFNFQHAWTSGWLAAEGMSSSIQPSPKK